MAVPVLVELVEQRVLAVLVRDHLLLVAGRSERAAALRERVVDRVVFRHDGVEQRRTRAAQFREQCIDEDHFVAEDGRDQLRERIAERDAFAKPGRAGDVEERQQLGNQWLGDGQRANRGA